MRLACIICIYDYQFISQLLPQIPLNVDVYLVDNGPGWQEVNNYKTTYLKMTKNLGWLRGTNVGLITAEAKDYDAYVLMNDDVTLSRDFFDGIIAAFNKVPQAALLAPAYDDVYAHQKGSYLGPAADYQPFSWHQKVPFVDFTCCVIPRWTLNKIGLLDTAFQQYGWGADFHYALKVRESGGSIWVTYLSYLNHKHQGTAKQLYPDGYEGMAGNEMEQAMQRLWGQNWRDKLYDYKA